MISGALTRRAQELAEQGAAFVTATVVRVQHPTSVQPGNVALIHPDGTIEGFVGGVCAEQSVRLYSLKVIERGEPLLLRILPDGEDPDGEEVAAEEGSVTVQNPCLSGGAIEVFLEPTLPAPRMLVAGETPIAQALRQLAPELGLDVITGPPTPDDLAVVVAAHGRDELELLQAALEAGTGYVGLVASRKRGAAVIEALRSAGVAPDDLERIETPAGLDIGARSAAEIALSILARVVEVRRRSPAWVPRAPGAAAAPSTAVDPICAMTVVVGPGALSLEHAGEIVYFCGEGCRESFRRQHGL
jgi:xanthine dehydrogenase accessory factor